MDILIKNALLLTMAGRDAGAVPDLVYSARGHEVETVIIDGRIIVDGRRLMTMDEAEVVNEANEAAVSCVEKAAAKVLSLNKGPAAMMRQGLI